ncbi:pseudouridine synthase [Rozella allomycis CSF55]|uniref:Pseudouridine synthase n=1 Tax=Rozella allomycis (strain CSF55) TaxID=988480 RepID=A0A4P9YMP4_ROZAC|nr:pseudouridine synthase [Rozella allomycis CSF55]
MCYTVKKEQDRIIIKRQMDILYKDEDYIVVDKLYDLKIDLNSKASESDHLNNPNLADIMRRAFPDLINEKVYLVHQLDHATSGAICIALHKKAARYASKLFERRSVLKVYEAIVVGHVGFTENHVCIKIARDENHPIAMKVVEEETPESKRCETLVEFVNHGHIFIDGNNREVSFVRLYPKTGRQHQLRLTMKSLVGDYIYETGGGQRERMMLHAKELILPFDKRSHINPGEFNKNGLTGFRKIQDFSRSHKRHLQITLLN